MDSIKHKMESMTAVTAENVALATATEAKVTELKSDFSTSEKKISDGEKAVNKLEMSFDDAMTAHSVKNERLLEANKEAERAEQESAQVTRRKTLLEEESQRVQLRLIEVLDKLTVAESSLEHNERTAKVKEAEAQHYDEKATLVEAQLEEANLIRDESARKMEEAGRKLKMIQDELERVADKAEEFEAKIALVESKLETKQKTMGEMEIVSNENATKEDKYEQQTYEKRKTMELTETRAEFSERTVEKLEQSIDKLSDDYLAEKLKYRDISLQLDSALNDILDVSSEEASRMEEMHVAEKQKLEKEIAERAVEKKKNEAEKEELKVKAEAMAVAKKAEEDAAEKAAVEEKPVEEKPVEEAPNEEVPVEEVKTVEVPMEDVKKDDDERVLQQEDEPLQGPEVPPPTEHEVQVDTNNEN